MAGFKHIVVCSDFSENSNKAFDVAAGLAESGKMTVLHVVATGYNYEEMQVTSAGSEAAAYGEQAQARMREFYGAKGVAEIAIEYGDEAEKIVSYAQESGADLTVMGARGIGPPTALMEGGGVASKVVKHSRIPVLVVPA
jgi:nucleotide-binding universal stress UspA family protein